MGNKIFQNIIIGILSLSNILPKISSNILSNNDFEYEINNNEVRIIKYVGDNKNVDIPEIIHDKIVTSIERNAFTCNNKISKIYIPHTINEIKQNGIYTGNSKTIIEVSDENLHYCSYNGSLYSSDKKTLIRWSERYGEFNKILPSTENIGEYAFAGCNDIVSIDIPDNIKYMGDYVFANCINITDIKLSNSMTKINPYSFFCCRKLKNIYMPNEIYEIQDYAFAGCTSIENINIPTNTFSLGEGVFYNCARLRKIDIPENVLELKKKIFYGCKNLINITIPNNGVIIDNDAFDKCSNANITYSIMVDENDYDKEDEKISFVEIPSNKIQVHKNVFQNEKVKSNKANYILFDNRVVYSIIFIFLLIYLFYLCIKNIFSLLLK